MFRLAPLAVMLLSACNQQSGSRADEPPAAPAPANPASKEMVPQAEAEIVKDVDPGSAEAALSVLRQYRALIAQKRFAEAWAYWGHDGTDSGMTAAQFAASFDKYASYDFTLGQPGEIDAGMMQRWITIPVTVTGKLKDTSTFRLEGPMTLHHIAQDMTDVAPEQKLWRIRESGLKPRP